MKLDIQHAIHALHAITSGAAGYSIESFHERAADLECLDNEVLEVIEAQMLRDGPTPELRALRRDVEAIRTQLEDQQGEFFRELRIQVGKASSPMLKFRAQLRQYTAWPAVRDSDERERLHAFLARYLLPWPIPESTLTREPEMVGFHPTPIGIILDMLQQADFQAHDVLYDIGAGVGHVAILVHLLAGIQTRGIEIDPVYCAYARRLTDEVYLSGVQFLNIDARNADYADGSVFFLYTPFKDTLLHRVLRHIKRDTGDRKIRIYSFGPGTLQVAEQTWLQRCDQHGDHVDELAAFQNA